MNLTRIIDEHAQNVSTTKGTQQPAVHLSRPQEVKGRMWLLPQQKPS